MNARMTTIVLAVAVAFAGVLLAARIGTVRLPGDHQGYEPVQPLAFSHRLHAGELEMPCLSCHSGAERSRHAGIPSATSCMACHRFVTARFDAVRAEAALAVAEKREPVPIVSPELRKLYDALALGDDLKPSRSAPPASLEWIKVHNVPDFVYFDHRAHVTAGVTCQSCHGPVETMERVRQVGTLGMGWCVGCHRDPHGAGVTGRQVAASTDCAACHY
jgi:hypothetical protein